MNEQAITVIDNNPLAIIANGVDKGFDANQLAKLVDLYERVEAINSKRAYQEAMQSCQADLQSVVTDSQNKHTGSTYVDLGTLIHKIKPVYTKWGFSLSFFEQPTEKPGWIRCCVDVMHNRGWRETKWIDLPADGTGASGGRSSMNPVQGVGSTHTYARRYLTYDVFNIIVADTDLDGNLQEPTLNDEQVKLIERLLLESETDRKKFFEWAGCERVEDMLQKRFVNARDMLNKKIAKARAAK